MKNTQAEKTTAARVLLPVGYSALFSALLLICVGAFAAAGCLARFNNIIVWGLGMIPAALFYPVPVKACLNLFTGRDIKSGCLGAVAKSPGAFLIHGIIAYLCFACAAFAAIYYLALGKSDPSFYIMGGIYILFSLLLISVFFYAPLLTVHKKPRLWETYKSAVSLVFKNFPGTLLTLALLAAILSPAAAAMYFLHGSARLAAAVAAVFIYPLPVTLILTKNYAAASGLKKTREEPAFEKGKDEPAEIRFGSDDDYVFVNGRMIKNPDKKTGDQKPHKGE